MAVIEPEPTISLKIKLCRCISGKKTPAVGSVDELKHLLRLSKASSLDRLLMIKVLLSLSSGKTLIVSSVKTTSVPKAPEINLDKS